MTAVVGWGTRALGAPMRRVLALLVLVFATVPASAQDKVQLFATVEPGFGRLVLNFPQRLDLPDYDIRYDNGVLAVEFAEPIDAVLPDVAVALPGFVTVARVDPDNRGIRFGLRRTFNVNHLEAGEKLFIDLMPPTWQGLPPGLPPEVVATLEQRAERAVRIAEQKRRAEEAARLRPVSTLRVGRNPTFVRARFGWTVDTEAEFAIDGTTAILDFGWPVPVDLYALKADLPPELVAVENSVTADGSRVTFTTAEGVVPRFYEISPTEFVVDIDVAPAEPGGTVSPEALATNATLDVAAGQEPVTTMAAEPEPAQTEIVPYVTVMGGTVRLVFPFERDVAAAVFRRGDILWLLFDTAVAISEPRDIDALTPVATGFSVLSAAGTTRVIRLDLATDRLTTLGTEGRSWVLSLGDVILSPTAPIDLNRRRDTQAQFEMTADLGQPGSVHKFRDPMAGDVLTVVTAFPPARGVMRSLDYVDFAALASVHGLVIRPKSGAVDVGLEGSLAVINGGATGLVLSSADHARGLSVGSNPDARGGYINLAALDEENPAVYRENEDALLDKAAAAEEHRAIAEARLELAHFYIANRFAEEAIGVLAVLEPTLEEGALRQRTRLSRAIADTLAERPDEAVAILTEPRFLEDPDAVMWRAIARAGAGDFRAARLDAMASEMVIESYPVWVRNRFLMAAVEASIEMDDIHLARRYLSQVDFAALDPEDASYFVLYVGRLAEAEEQTQEALDAYGQVIAADIRPSRAEAVYRTLLVLDRQGMLDIGKAADTLAAEAMLWRGGPIETAMLRFLSDLYFRNGDYRLGFETVRQAVRFSGATADGDAMNDLAQATFADLYLNGAADRLEPVEALTLFYDFRNLTPAGARGDEMIRNLARRLVDVDLLQQAGDLLQYQIENRLEGPAEAQIAAELAVIRIAQNDPDGALRALNGSRLADLSPMLERQRRILEAKALIDAGRQELAIDLLSSVKGRDADLLRIEGLWQGEHYAEAAELIEIAYGSDPADLLNRPARMTIIKAAVGFVLAGDQLGLSRLRSKFAERLALTPEWPMFDYVTSTISTTSNEFRDIVREVAGMDRLDAFLESYRATYGEGLDPASL